MWDERKGRTIYVSQSLLTQKTAIIKFVMTIYNSFWHLQVYFITVLFMEAIFSSK